MDERGGDQNAGTEMSNGKEEAVRDSQAGELCGQNWESTSKSRDTKNKEESTNVKRQVVGPLINTANGAGRSRSLSEKGRELNRRLRNLSRGRWDRSVS